MLNLFICMLAILDFVLCCLKEYMYMLMGLWLIALNHIKFAIVFSMYIPGLVSLMS